MATRKQLDLRPGPLPDIRSDGDSVIFDLQIAGAHSGSRLIIRCDVNGNVWASIPAPEEPRRG